jgi:hypothetical protein
VKLRFRVQLDWCKLEGVSRAIFSHCGSEIVGAGEHAVLAKVQALGREHGVRAEVAHDRMEVVLARGGISASGAREDRA